MAKIDKDPFLNRWMSFGIVGVAVMIAATTAYVPLGIIGRGHDDLLLWVMPTWLVALTLVSNWLLRKAYRRWW